MSIFKKLGIAICIALSSMCITACGVKITSSVQDSSNETFSIESSSSVEVISSFKESSSESSSIEASLENSSSAEESSSLTDSSSANDSSSTVDSSQDDSSSTLPEPVYDLNAAAEYLKDFYSEFPSEKSDYYVIKSFALQNVTYAVTWTVDVEFISIIERDYDYHVKIEEFALDDLSYLLSATITDPDGNSKNVDFERVLYGIKHDSTAIELNLKELRTNIDEYVGKRVAFEGTVSTYSGYGVYVEDYDEYSAQSFGIYAYYGFGINEQVLGILSPGNRVRIVGNLTYSENFGYQISNLKYDPFDPYNPNIIYKISEGYEAAYREITPKEFYSQVEIDGTTYNVTELSMCTTVSFINLKVTSVYTSITGSDNDGALTLYCEGDKQTIVVRIAALKNANGELIFTEDMFQDKTIDVKGIVDLYNGEYQIKVFYADNVLV